MARDRVWGGATWLRSANPPNHESGTVSLPLGITTAISGTVVGDSEFSWPDATNTGYVGAGLSVGDLTPSSSLTITAAGVYELLDITGTVNVDLTGMATGEEVIIRQGRLRYSSGGTPSNAPAIRVTAPSDPLVQPRLVVEDFEVDGTNLNLAGQTVAHACVGNTTRPGCFTLRRVHLHHAVDIVQVARDVLIEDSYLHTPQRRTNPSVSDHIDGCQSNGGNGGSDSTPIIIRRSQIRGPYQDATSAIIMATTSNPLAMPILVEDCYLAGGNQCVNIFWRRSTSFYPPKDATVRRCIFEYDSIKVIDGVGPIAFAKSSETNLVNPSFMHTYDNAWDDGTLIADTEYGYDWYTGPYE